ncbi:MAG TPA: hypothetical protein VJ732_05785 [Bryobacteraceae bacterium]|nr:hypothetical protein [Bryobacteraceae bacterium]
MAVLALFAAPLVAFLVAINRPVRLVPLEGIQSRCAVCDRKATRTLPRAAKALRTKGIYVYSATDYPGGLPAWCDLHGPDKVKENAGMAYLSAIGAFLLVAGVSAGARKLR